MSGNYKTFGTLKLVYEELYSCSAQDAETMTWPRLWRWESNSCYELGFPFINENKGQPVPLSVQATLLLLFRRS